MLLLCFGKDKPAIRLSTSHVYSTVSTWMNVAISFYDADEMETLCLMLHAYLSLSRDWSIPGSAPRNVGSYSIQHNEVQRGGDWQDNSYGSFCLRRYSEN